MDKTDIGILKALQEDGRASAQQLSEKVGLSAAPVWRRVKAMEASGVIQGYSAQVDRSKVGLGCICLLYTSPSPRDRQKSRMPSSA